MENSTTGGRAMLEGSQRAFAVANLGGKVQGSFLIKLMRMHLETIPMSEEKLKEVKQILDSDRRCA